MYKPIAIFSLVLTAMFGLGLSLTAAASDRSTIEAAVVSNVQQLVADRVRTLGDDRDDDEHDDEHDDDNGGDLGGTWNGNVSFTGMPEKDFNFTWNLTRVFDDFYMLEAERTDDAAVQNGLAAHLSHGRPDVAFHPGFGAESETCKYFFVGDASDTMFSGFAFYVCDGAEPVTGAFTASR